VRCMCPVMLYVWVRLFPMHAAHVLVLVGAVLLPLPLVLTVAATVPLRAPEFLCLHLVLPLGWRWMHWHRPCHWHSPPGHWYRVAGSR